MNAKQPWPKSETFSAGIFAALTEEEWRSMTGFPTPIVYNRKTTLFLEGRPATHIYLVGNGLVKTYKKASRDRVQIVGILRVGDVAGAAALTRDVYLESASALTRSLIFKCEKEFFLDFIKHKSEVALALIQTINRESAELRSLLCDMGTKMALSRVASCLVFIMERQIEVSENRPLNLPVSRQEMGELVGLSPETISRQLKDLISSKVIKLEHKRLTILDLTQLKAIAQV